MARGGPRRQCAAVSSRTGKRCEKAPIAGGTVCYTHGGRAPMVARRAAVRAEVMAWGLDDEKVEGSEVMLRLLAQSSRRVQLYSGLLEAEYDSEAQLADAFAGSGLKALIGHKFGLTRAGDPVAVEEAVRGLVDLESSERDRCARFSKIVIDADLEERRVRVEEGQAALVASVLRAALSELGLGDWSDEVLKVVSRRLEAVA